MRLRVTYGRVTDFLNDHNDQIARGGLLVRVTSEPALARGAAVELEIVTPVGAVVVPGSILQVLATVGIAVAFGSEQVAALAAAAGGYGGVDSGPAPLHEVVAAPSSPPAREPAPLLPPAESLASQGAAMAAKIQQALHGDKNHRTAIMRETNKNLHAYVVRNPNIQLDEVVAIARMSVVSAEVLAYIAGRREWGERPDVAAALVRNPKTPVPLAIRMLDRVSPSELRLLAKQASVREAILRAARKKVVG